MKPKFYLGVLGAMALSGTMNQVNVQAANPTGLVQLWQVVPEGQQGKEGATTSQIMDALQCRPNHNLYKVSGGKSEHNTYVNSCYVDDVLYLGDLGDGYRVYVAGYEGKVMKSESHYFDLDLNGDGKTARYEIQTIARVISAPSTKAVAYDDGYDDAVQILETTSDYLTKMDNVEENIELFTTEDSAVAAYSGAETRNSYQVKTPSYYRTVGGELQHLLSNNVWGDTYSASIVGKAPSWMKEGVKYYSYDGVYFYNDWRDINVDGSGAINESNPFYNYYQWLPFRSISNMSASNLNSFVTQRGYTKVPSKYPANGNESKLVNTGSIFKSVESNYGINGAMQFAMGIHESGWGRSSLSINKNNLFGMNATDNNPYGNGTSFDSVEKGINYHADRYLSWGYTDPLSDARYFGSHVGNKGSGMNVKYASDPFWGEKIAGWYYRIDSENGYKDYNHYSIGIKQDNSNYNVRDSASTSGKALYMTKNGSSNIRISEYPFLVVGQSGDFYRIQSDTPIVNGAAKFSGQYKFSDSMVFVSKDAVDAINHKNFNRPQGSPSTNAKLSTLKTNVGTLTPSFNPSTTNYTLNVASNVTSVTLSGTLQDSGATVVSGLTKHTVKPGANTIKVVTKAENGSQLTYTITVNVDYPESMTSARFSTLTSDIGAFKPSFTPTTTAYRIELDKNASSITFSGKLESATAKVVSGLGKHSLKEGENLIEIKTQNELGWSLSYKITVVNPKAKSTSLKLASLTTDVGKLSPSFKPDTTSYRIELDKNASSITFSGKLESSSTKVVSGLGKHSLSNGENVIKIKTQNTEGKTMTYTITVVNPIPDKENARLATLKPSVGKLSPSFSPTTTKYTINLSEYTSSISFSGTLQTSSAKVVSGLGKHSLNVGANEIVIKTRNALGWDLNYKITVNVPSPTAGTSNDVTNARLSSLTFDRSGKLSPVFDGATQTYTYTLSSYASSIKISGTLQASGAKLVSGFGTHNLNVGTNTIKLQTQAKNGWKLNYTVKIKVPEKSSNARLKDLKLSAGKISPSFSPTTTAYTVTMPAGARSITLSSSGLEHSGAKVVSGLGKHSLKVGTNTITVQTQAENGWYLNYKLTIKVPS